MSSADCLVHIISWLTYFTLVGLISVKVSQASVFNTFSLPDNQLITKFYLDSLHSNYSSVSSEHFELIDSPTITIVCKDNANISLELGVTAGSEIRSQPLIIIPSEEVDLSLFPSVRSYFVLVRASSTSNESDATDSTHFYTPSLVHIRKLVDKTESVLEWEALEVCVHIIEPSFAAALVILTDFDQYEDMFPFFVPKDTEDVKSALTGVLSPEKAETRTNISRTDEADDKLNDQPDKRNSNTNEYSREKYRKQRFRNLILPESQWIYTTFRYSRHSVGESGEPHRPTEKQTDPPYVSELKAVAIQYMTGFGSDCLSEPNTLVVELSLSSEDQDEKSYQEVVDYYLTLLNLKCYPSLSNSTIRLFQKGILIPTRGWKVALNHTKAYTTQRILSPIEFEEIISAFYFTSFSKSYITIISNKSPVTSTPSGKLISSSSRLISLFTLNLLQLFPHFSTYKSFIDFHLVKILSRLRQTLEYFYLTLLKEGNQLVCQDYEGNSPSPCQALRKIKFNNLMQIAGLIHFLTHKIPDLMSFQNDLDYNYAYTEHFRHHRDEILNFVRNSVKNKSIT